MSNPLTTQVRNSVRRLALLTVAAAAMLAATASPAAAGPSDLFVRMSGGVEVPGPGDPDGRGAALIDLRENSGQVCAGVRFNRLASPFTGMHIHTGGPGASGAVVVNLSSLLTGGTRCVDGISSEVISQIRMTPGLYYLNVHNQAFPAGAIRGQLNRSEADSDFTTATGPNQPFVRLNGAEEVPGPGDADGRGAAFVSLRPGAGEACVDVRWRGIDNPPTAMHIHRGAKGVSGPVVIGFVIGGPRCVAASPALVQEISDDPGGFYLNVHTGVFPAGAMRGQLQDSIGL